MDRDEYLSAIESEATDLMAAAEGDLNCRVPSCPDWVVGDLVRHLGEVYEFFTDVVASGATEVGPLRARHMEVRDKRGADFARTPELLPWFRERTAMLLTALRSRDPEERLWTWWEPEQRVGWYDRRMAHETAVHRWDVQNAGDVAKPIESKLAADGVDEALTMHVPDRRDECDEPARGEVFGFRTTDVPNNWTVRLNAGEGVDVTRVRGRNDVAIEGSASDLLLYLWQRIPADSLSIEGDRTLLDRWFDLVPPD